MLKKYFSIKLKTSKLMITLSLATLFILILATVTIMTIISKTPIIILALGQAQAGQIDLVLQSSDWNGRLNSTKIEQLTQVDAMPRISISPLNVNGLSGTGWLMDFSKQNKNNLGRFGYQIAQDQVFLHDSYQAKSGSVVDVQFLPTLYLLHFISDAISQSKLDQNTTNVLSRDFSIVRQTNLKIPFKVASTFATSMGKFKEGATPFYAYFNIKTLMSYIIKYSSQNLTLENRDLLNQFVSKINFEQYAEKIIINLPDRNTVYENPNYDQTAVTLNQFGISIINKVGVYAVETEMPILYQISKMAYFGMFIGVILKLIIISLFSLSVLMMYNMMMIGVETKNFDFGMLRTVGMTKSNLVGTVLFDSLKYVIVANIFAFPASILCLRLAGGIFEKFFGYNYILYPTFDSLAVATVVGFLVPIVSSFVPIQVALSEKIIEAINPIRNKTIGLKTQVYVQGRQFPWGRFIFGFVGSTFGFMIYYLLPKSLIDQDIGMLLTVFFSLLIGLLLGLVLLSYSFHYLLQKLIAYLTLFWVKATDFTITLKNLSAHRIKNRRAALLYSLSVSFIVFVSVGIQIQIQTIYNELLKEHGCYLEVTGDNLNKRYYDSLLTNQYFKNYISDFSYQTVSLNDLLRQNQQDFVNVQYSDKARVFFYNADLYAVTPNFLSTLYFQNFDIKDTLSTSGLDPFQYLYTPDGQGTTIVGEYMANQFQLDLKQSPQYLLTINHKTSARVIKLKASSIFSKNAGIQFSSFMFMDSDIAVSLATYAQLANLRSYNDIKFNRLKIKLNIPTQSTMIANAIRREISNKGYDSVWDYTELVTTIVNIEQLLKKIFLILLLVVLLISFFSLLTTTSTNILNQTKQISILLGLGLQKSRITRIYIYQAFVLVLTACLIGVFVGAVVAYLMGLQRQLFGDFTVSIDISGIWVILIAAVISAVASTYAPIQNILKNKVAQIMKLV